MGGVGVLCIRLSETARRGAKREREPAAPGYACLQLGAQV